MTKPKTIQTEARTKAVASWKEREREKGRTGRDYWATPEEHEKLKASLKRLRNKHNG